MSEQIKKILEHPILKELKASDLIIQEMVETHRKSYLNDCTLEHFRNSKNKCSKCERLAQYKNVDNNTFLCWNHSLE
jgi:hypothetical protein